MQATLGTLNTVTRLQAG